VVVYSSPQAILEHGLPALRRKLEYFLTLKSIFFYSWISQYNIRNPSLGGGAGRGGGGLGIYVIGGEEGELALRYKGHV
jgi:hypothetical protein